MRHKSNGWEGWTEQRLKDLEKKGNIKVITQLEDKPKKKRAKYGNKKVEYDGHTFDSKKEYKRYRELLLLLKAFEIAQLELQVPYELNEGGTHSLKYVADFVYMIPSTGEKIVEDCKGFKTKTYLKKKRLMKKVYGIEIKET